MATQAIARKPDWIRGLNEPTDRREINPLIVRLAQILDESIQIPGTNVKFGLDAIIGLFPEAQGR